MYLINLLVNYTRLIHVHPIRPRFTLQYLFRDVFHLALLIHQLLSQGIEQTLLYLGLRFAVVDDSS